jgi:hypothetical protein
LILQLQIISEKNTGVQTEHQYYLSQNGTSRIPKLAELGLDYLT